MIQENVYKVEFNGQKVWAVLNADFEYEGYNSDMDIDEGVVNETAQDIYNAVKNAENDEKIIVYLSADFDNGYVQRLIDTDYSRDFTQADEYFYKENGYDYEWIGINGEEVEYDRDEIEDNILRKWKRCYKYSNDYEDWVNDKLQELGFDELCEEKGVEVEIDYDYQSMEIDYYGEGHFNFNCIISLYLYEKEEEED